MPFLPPTNSVKALKANHTLAQYAVLEGIDLALTDLRVREITFTYPSVRSIGLCWENFCLVGYAGHGRRATDQTAVVLKANVMTIGPSKTTAAVTECHVGRRSVSSRQGRNGGYHFPSPSLPFPPLSRPYLLSPLEIGPLIELEGLGSAVSFPSGVQGRAPAIHAFLRTFTSKGGLL